MAQTKRKILVHVCCTACASHVFSCLKRAGFAIMAVFYNPSIDDEDEYKKRLSDLQSFCEGNDIELIAYPYSPKDFWKSIEPFKDKESIKYINDQDRYQRRRCKMCNSAVIQEVVEQAKEQRVNYFTTTLLCSPYKDHDEIVEIANDKALDYQLNFYYQDFRKGYWMGRNYARNNDVYLSDRCGCLESKKEKRLE